jgi:hypothetical protein
MEEIDFPAIIIAIFGSSRGLGERERKNFVTSGNSNRFLVLLTTAVPGTRIGTLCANYRDVLSIILVVPILMDKVHQTLT